MFCAKPTQRATIKSDHVSFTGASLSRLGGMNIQSVAVLHSMLLFAGAFGTCAAQERKSPPDVNGPRVFSWPRAALQQIDRKSTRLNSSHRCISYAVLCLK